MNHTKSFKRTLPHSHYPHPNRPLMAALNHAPYEKDGYPKGRAWKHSFNVEGMLTNNFGQGREEESPPINL